MTFRVPSPMPVLVVTLAATLLLLLSGFGSPIVAAVGSGAGPSAHLASLSTPTVLPGHDWPTYLQNDQRTSANIGDDVLNVSNAPSMVELWNATTHRSVAASAAIVGDRTYIGSWDGNFTAYNLLTGAVVWKTFLGVSAYCPTKVTIGVSSSATIYRNTVYVGGGNGTYWALNATNGKVVWMYKQGSPLNGYYSWSSPLVWDGHVYVGAASLCDMPLVPGGLYELDASNGTLDHLFRTVSPTMLGGSIWSSPSLDVARNTIYVTTGNPPNATDGTNYTQAMIAVNATTLAVESYWDVPANESIFDGDFGATPTLFQDRAGAPLVGAINKNGFFYTLNRTNLSKGPVWYGMLSHASSVEPAAFAQGLLFVATRETKVAGKLVNGSVEALAPATGHVIWKDALSSGGFGAPTTANGLLFVPAGHVLSVIEALNGAVLKTFTCPAGFLSAPSVGHGVVVEGCADGKVRAFGLPNSTGTGRPAASPERGHGGVESAVPVMARGDE
ncbi:MAG: PQQ-binding-like beta-propeller repeat protein [Thermoplasmata archaeon]|nr:PQQ-binding-like beta-propeller repeat protein [Thermoplasmata archaeon]